MGGGQLTGRESAAKRNYANKEQGPRKKKGAPYPERGKVGTRPEGGSPEKKREGVSRLWWLSKLPRGSGGGSWSRSGKTPQQGTDRCKGQEERKKKRKKKTRLKNRKNCAKEVKNKEIEGD